MEMILHIDKIDNLVTCLRNVKKGETVEVEGEKITVNSDIPEFHKMAIADIEQARRHRRLKKAIMFMYTTAKAPVAEATKNKEGLL